MTADSVLAKLIQDINVFYATDNKNFYQKDDERRKPLSDSGLLTLCQLAGHQDPVDLIKLKYLIMQSGIPYNSGFKKKQDKKGSPKLLIKLHLDQAYNELKASLPFIFVKKKEGGTFAFRRISENEVVTVKTPKNEDLVSSLQAAPETYQRLTSYYKEEEYLSLVRGEMILTTFLEEIMDRAKEDSELFTYELPKFITWTKGELAFKYFDESILVDGPTPYYDNFCGRLDYPEVFMAWVWSIFEPENNGRQIMWIKGKGHDGKSTVFNALSTFIGKEHSSNISEKDFKSGFFFNEVYGRILLCYPDCNIRKILEHEEIKNITGGDEQLINAKFAQPFKASVYSKVLIGSNIYPDVNMLFAYQKSRIICMDIAPLGEEFGGDSKAGPALIKETPAFLKKCRAVYSKYVEKNSSLKLPKELIQDMKVKCTSLEMSIIEEFCNEKLVIGPTHSISRMQLQAAISTYFAEANMKGQATYSIPLFEEYVKTLSKDITGITNIQKASKPLVGYKGFNLKENLNIKDKS
jgi:hypothetical protein